MSDTRYVLISLHGILLDTGIFGQYHRNDTMESNDRRLWQVPNILPIQLLCHDEHKRSIEAYLDLYHTKMTPS